MVAFVPISLVAPTPVHKEVQVVDQALCVVIHEIITPSSPLWGQF